MQNSNRLLLAATLSMLDLRFIKSFAGFLAFLAQHRFKLCFCGIAMRITEDLTHRWKTRTKSIFCKRNVGSGMVWKLCRLKFKIQVECNNIFKIYIYFRIDLNRWSLHRHTAFVLGLLPLPFPLLFHKSDPTYDLLIETLTNSSAISQLTLCFCVFNYRTLRSSLNW